MVDSNATDEDNGEVAFPIQAYNGKNQLEGHVTSGLNPWIEGLDRELEVLQTNENEDTTSKVPRARTRTAVAKDKNKVLGIADRVQEDIEGSKLSKGKVFPW